MNDRDPRKRVLIAKISTCREGRGVTSEQPSRGAADARMARDKAQEVMVTSHRGSPKEGVWSAAFAAPVAVTVSECWPRRPLGANGSCVRGELADRALENAA